jgi:[glutamine synthetase] adenylyltransferase / [glutamine synthetase]-adenylyl-L-tyrosine phosphorylase
MNINRLIKEASGLTPDPAKSLNNLERLCSVSAEFIERHEEDIIAVASLFSYSQFLADYCISRPEKLGAALQDIGKPVGRREILTQARSIYRDSLKTAPLPKQFATGLLRDIKKTHLLRITLRDVTSITGLNQCVSELSSLAEAILELAIEMASALMREKFGDMKGNAFSVIGMGKLGAGELNYSSDIDIVTVYRSEVGSSSGIRTASGVRTNPIDPQEYFCRLTETMTGLIQTPTEDGIAYRVDFRLRPNGRKGALSLPLSSCLSYYESWGKTWERVALIRARPVAGDSGLGGMFMEGVEPFVWKRSLDYNDIEEIKALKKKIDTIFDVNDIKRGYGGIREIEFFVQTFQLLYGGEKVNLRSGRLLTVLGELKNEGLLTDEDVKILTGSYLFLRRIEHVLQMKDDLQLYVLPTDGGSLKVLASKLRFDDEKKFSSEVRLTRLKVRDMYNSLFGGAETAQDFLISADDELPEDSLLEYFSFKGFKAPSAAIKNIHILQEQLVTGKTLRERGLLRKVVPSFLDEVFKSPNKDRALTQLTSFIEKIGSHESFTDLLQKRDDTREALIRTFSASIYLTRLLLGLENLEGIFEFPDVRMDFRSLQDRLITALKDGDPLKIVRDFKAAEELKTGMLFLNRAKDAYGLMAALSSLADVVLRSVVRLLRAEKGFAVIGLGGYGARELNFGSDLDLLFVHTPGSGSVSGPEGQEEHIAKEIIKILAEYTDSGVAYKVDMRLRPDGSKGVLMNDIQGYSSYYLKSAQPWEIQSLLRARPIAGDRNLLEAFDELRRTAIQQRRKEITGRSVKEIRTRIVRELSREHKGFDIKLGPGGIKEIEFIVQYLQLKYIDIFPDLILQNTTTALKSIIRHKLIDGYTSDVLTQSHRFLRTVEILLRLNGEDVLKTNSEIPDIIIGLLNLKSKDELFGKIENIRQQLSQITGILYH